LPNLRGAILFLEDVAAKPYQIDRMFTQLRLAGCLEEVQGIVFGEMLDCEQHPEQGYRLDDVLADLTRDLGVPVLAGVPSGHTRSLAVTLPFGVAARVDGEGLEILEGAVS
jgi:muramoyltetrapeptide carboxypeptidase